MDTTTAHTTPESSPDAVRQAHLLQMEAWGRLKSAHGWSYEIAASDTARALVLFRPLPLGFSLAYIPMGPTGDWFGLLPELDALCRKHRAIALKVEPDVADSPAASLRLEQHGFLRSPQTIQPPRTLLIDLDTSEEEILARMAQKTRYNIRLAGRKGVVVRPSQDIGMFTRMIRETGERNEFGVHSPDYYHQAYDLFHPSGHCELLAAGYEGQPLAALMVFKAGKRAWYLYGASSNEHRNRMPTYLLQWEAIRWARNHGCDTYDLWGIPDEEPDVLEDQFTNRDDGLWGVYRFKRGFGGRHYRAVGAWDRPYHPAYRLYQLLMKMRKAS